MRKWFIDKIAGPLVTHMFDKGLHIRLAQVEADTRRLAVERGQLLQELEDRGKQLLTLQTSMKTLEEELLKYRGIANQAQMEILNPVQEDELGNSYGLGVEDQIWWLEMHHPERVPKSTAKKLSYEVDHLPAEDQ